MYYEINIALNGYHFFATAPRSLTDHRAFEKCREVLRAKFPESEGYTITCTQWQTTGRDA